MTIWDLLERAVSEGGCLQTPSGAIAGLAKELVDLGFLVRDEDSQSQGAFRVTPAGAQLVSVYRRIPILGTEN